MNLPGASASIFDRNKFLAEDRILAFGTLIPSPSSLVTSLTYSSPLRSHLHPRGDDVVLKLISRNRYQEASEMEVTIREICQSRYRRPINSTRIYLPTTKMAQWVSSSILYTILRREETEGEVRADDRSIFAAVYAMVCFWRIWTSGHGFVRKIMLNLITIYSMCPTPTPLPVK